MPLGVEVGVDLRPHVSHNNFARAFAAFRRPARAGTEHPGDTSAGLFEGHSGAVERGHQRDVVQHRGDVEQLRIEVDAFRAAEGCGEGVRSHAVVEQGGGCHGSCDVQCAFGDVRGWREQVVDAEGRHGITVGCAATGHE